jgi:hypothetical protein
MMRAKYPLAEVVQALNASGVPWGVFAGAAVRAYGGIRPITDIDILIPDDAGSLVSQQLPQAKCNFRADGSISDLHLADIEIIAGLSWYLTFSLDVEMAARLVDGALLGVKIRLISVEDNLAFKAILGRGPEVGKHDWEDAETLLRLHTPDWGYLRWRLEQTVPGRTDALLLQLKRLAV